MKKEYESPELKFVSIRLQDVLAVSKDEYSTSSVISRPDDEWIEDDGL
ncbi:hypothetical protein [Ruminococcus sp.]